MKRNLIGSNLLRWLPSGRSVVIGVPYSWLLIFFLIPFIIVLKISLSEAETAIPPYSDVFQYVDEAVKIILNLGNYLFLWEDDLYFAAYVSSLKIAFVSTVFCLLLGYPMAYAMAQATDKWKVILLLSILLPSWTSFLIRIYAWIGILKNNGLVNNLLMSLSIIDNPLPMLNTNFAVYVGIVYTYLPFMVLPIYAVLTKLDTSLLEASADLGAKPWQSFLRVTLPLSKGGIIAGSMLVFIPVVGEFVIPELLGGPESLMIGKVLWQEFFNNRDWPIAAALAMVMLALLTIPITLFHKYQAKELESQ